MARGDREAALRADAQWLDGLAGSLAHSEYSAMRSYMLSSDRNEGLRNIGVTAEKLAAWFGSQGTTVLSELIHIAIVYCQSNADEHSTMPEDLMFTQASVPSINGFAVRTPNLGAVGIVLNHGLVANVAVVVHLIMGLTKWKDERYCNHFTDAERLIGLVELARSIRDRRPFALVSVTGVACIGATDHLQHGLVYEATCVIAELFVIVHELGHATLGHLTADDVSMSFGQEFGRDLPVFNRSQVNEFEADAFAYKQLERAFVQGSGLQQRDLLYAVGCLFVLATTVSHVSTMTADTHPPGFERWVRLKTLLSEPSVPCGLDSIDYFFSWARAGGLDAITRVE